MILQTNLQIDWCFYTSRTMTPRQAYFLCFKEKKRNPELEPIILTSLFYSYYYARDIIKGRWTEAESRILTDLEYSYYYARDIIKGRWSEAEPIIKQDDYCWELYCIRFNVKKAKYNWKIGL